MAVSDSTAARPPDIGRTAGFLVTMLVVHNVHRSAVLPIFAELQQRLSTDYTGVGALFAAYVIGYSISQSVAGMVNNRTAPRTVLLFGLALSTVFSAGFAMTDGLGWALFFRFLLGTTGTILYTPSMSMAITHFPPQSRGKATGWMQSGAGVGSIAALVLTPILCAVLGTAGGLLSWSFATMVVGCVTLRWFPRVPAAVVERPDGGVPRLSDFRSLWLVLAISFVGMLASYGFLTWIPTFLSVRFGFSAIIAGALATIPSIALTFAAPLAGRLADQRLGRTAVVMGGSLLALASFLLLALFDSLVPALLLSVSLGVSLAATTAPLMLLAGELFDPAVARRVVALIAAIGQAGSTVAGVLFGALVSAGMAFETVWMVCAALCAVRILALARLARGSREG